MKSPDAFSATKLSAIGRFSLHLVAQDPFSLDIWLHTLWRANLFQLTSSRLLSHTHMELS